MHLFSKTLYFFVQLIKQICNFAMNLKNLMTAAIPWKVCTFTVQSHIDFGLMYKLSKFHTLSNIKFTDFFLQFRVI